MGMAASARFGGGPGRGSGLMVVSSDRTVDADPDFPAVPSRAAAPRDA